MGLYRIQPVISSTALTCVTTAGSPVVTSSAQFGSVTVGMRVVGAGVPWNTTVDTVTSTSSITLSNPVLATSGAVALRFGYFTSLAYSSGDAFGFPFELKMFLIRNLLLIDASKTVSGLRVYFFSKPFTASADNAAWAPSAADMANLIGYISITGKVQDDTNAWLVTQAVTALPYDLGGGNVVYCQAVLDAAAGAFSTVSDVSLVFAGD